MTFVMKQELGQEAKLNQVKDFCIESMTDIILTLLQKKEKMNVKSPSSTSACSPHTARS